MFRKFDPLLRMIIDRDTGLLHEYFAVEKSQLIDFYYWNTLKPSENDTEEEYPDENGYFSDGTKDEFFVPGVSKTQKQWLEEQKKK